MARVLTGLILLLSAGLAIAAGSDASDSTTYRMVLFMHQVLFVFWLGPDIGVYMWSTKAVNAELTPAQRVSAGRIMRVIDVLPKVCMSLMLTVGGILTELKGIEHPWWQMVGIWLLGPVWLTLTLLVFFRAGSEAGAKLAQYDIWFRWIVVVSVIASTGLSIFTDRLAAYPWITGKLLLFAAIVFFSIMLRTRMLPFMQGIDQLDGGDGSDQVNAKIAASVSSARPFLFATWIALAMAAGLGLVQPGTEAPVAQVSASE